MRIALIILALAAVFATACGGNQMPECAIPPDQTFALQSLEGEWDVYLYDGNLDGSMAFEGDCR